MGFVETDQRDAWQKEQQAVAALPPFVSEPQRRGLHVELDLTREAAIKPEAGRVGQIHLGRMTVPDLRGISWAEVLQSMQEIGARAQVSGIRFPQSLLSPIEIGLGLLNWKPRLPEPGEYEIGVWSLVSIDEDPIHGRKFHPKMAAEELKASGFKGASSLFLLAHAVPELLLLEGQRFTLGERGDLLIDQGQEYMPYYVFDREVCDGNRELPLVWKTSFCKVDYRCYADHKAFGFRPVTK